MEGDGFGLASESMLDSGIMHGEMMLQAALDMEAAVNEAIRLNFTLLSDAVAARHLEACLDRARTHVNYYRGHLDVLRGWRTALTSRTLAPPP